MNKLELPWLSFERVFNLHEPLCVFMGLWCFETNLEGEKVIIFNADVMEKLSFGCFLAIKVESIFSKMGKAGTVEP